MDLQPSPPEKTIPTTAEAMQQSVSAEKKCYIFYKLIVQSIILEKELGIPKKFGKKIGDKLPDVVTLIDCNSAKWKIGLRRLNHRLWLHHGWPKFMEDHSIHVGSFLIFQYEGNSNFAVYIYDLTESEMKVSFDNPGIRPEPARAEQIEVASIRSSQSKDLFQTVMLPSPSKTPKDKPFVKCGAEKTPSVIADSIMRPVLEMRDKPAPKIGVRVNADELIKNQSKCKRRLLSELDDCCNKKKQRMEVHDKKASFLKWKRTPRAVTDEERRRVVLTTESFKSNFPFCRIMMRVSYVYYRFVLYLPAEFTKKHLKDIQGVIELQDPSGRKWPVRFGYKDNRSRLTTGWRDFAVENNLDDGDVCIFELVQRDDIVLKVSIFRAVNPEVVQVYSESTPKSIPSVVADNIPVEKREQEINPAQHFGPKDYANDFTKKLNEDINIIAPQKPTPGCSKADNAIFECKAENTSSNVADCIDWPPLEKRDKHVQGIGIRVNADYLMKTRKEVKNSHLANQKLPDSMWKRRMMSELDDCCNKKSVKMEARTKASSLKWKRKPRTVTDEEKRQAVHAAANFTSKFPFCRMVMRPSYVYSRCNLYLPADFSKKYLEGIQGPIMLKDSNGRKWPARCRYRKSSAIITTGWRDLVVANNLDGGDVCIFELGQMEEDILLLKVSIFRATTNPKEEIVQVYGESVPQNIEGSEQEVNLDERIDTEDYENDFMENLNEDVYAETGIRFDAQQEANNFNYTDPPNLPDSEWKIRLTSELDECSNKKKVKMEERNKDSFLKWKRRSRTVTDEEKKRAVHAAAKFTSKFPFFQMVMRPSYVYYSYVLHLPAGFSKKHLKDIGGIITLRDPDGREWLARCNYSSYTAKLRKGWHEFAVDNNLDDGDVCIFELVQKEDDTVVLKVTIFRSANPEVMQ